MMILPCLVAISLICLLEVMVSFLPLLSQAYHIIQWMSSNLLGFVTPSCIWQSLCFLQSQDGFRGIVLVDRVQRF